MSFFCDYEKVKCSTVVPRLITFFDTFPNLIESSYEECLNLFEGLKNKNLLMHFSVFRGSEQLNLESLACMKEESSVSNGRKHTFVSFLLVLLSSELVC